MRFLADENFPRRAVAALRERGWLVEWVRESAPSAPDVQVIAQAVESGAVILTFDKDFGELARNSKKTVGFGVLLFRFPLQAGTASSEMLVRIIESRSDWAGHFSVAEIGRVRTRPLSVA